MSETGMSWIECPLEDSLVLLMDFRGRTPKKLGMAWGNGDVPALSALNVRQGKIAIERTKHFGSIELHDHWMAMGPTQRGDVLITTEAPLGNVAQIPDDKLYILSQRVILLRPHAELLLRDFLAMQFRSESLQQALRANESGSTVRGIRQSRLRKISTKVPPLNEQRRIVAKIEALQARSDAAKQALDAVGPLLEQFRQSVLAAAFRGDLTASWREQNPDVEPASALLERIRVERKARFIAAAGDKARGKAEAKARAAGKAWSEADAAAVVEKARAKAETKYVEPEPVDTEGLPELPRGWCWTTGEELFAWGSGRNLPSSSMNEGPIPVYGGNGESGYHDSSNVGVTTIVIGRVGANCGNVHVTGGATWVTDNAIYATSASPFVMLVFVAAYLDGVNIRSLARGGGQPFVSQGTLNKLCVPVPPIDEQKVLAVGIDSCRKVLHKIGEIADEKITLLTQLNQSILAKAFRGELVPQDPNDEPASALLERIRAERAAAAPSKSKKKPRRKSKPKPKPTPVAEAKLEPKPPAKPKPTPASTPNPAPKQLELLVHVPPERVPEHEEPTEVMALLRTILRKRGAAPREEVIRALAGGLGYERVSAKLRKRIDGHLLASVRRSVLESSSADELRLATRRVEDYARDDLVAGLRSVSRARQVYEREELARTLLDHLGFRRMTQGAKAAIKSAFNSAVRRELFERVDATRLRRC